MPSMSAGRGRVGRATSTVLRAEPFADSSGIDSGTGMSYVVNRPTKYGSNPVYAGTDMSYDRHMVYCGATYVNNRVEMFTGVWDDNWGLATTGIGTTYGYSSDGRSFTKPNLGLVSYGGNTNNNILAGTGALNSSPNAAVGAQNMYYEPTHQYPYLIPVTHNTTSSASITRRIYGAQTPGGALTLVQNMGTWSASLSNTSAGTNVVRDITGLVRRSDNKWIATYQEYSNTERRSVGILLSDQTTLDSGTTWTNYGVPSGLLATQPYDQYYYCHPWRYGDTLMMTTCMFSGGSSGSLSDYYYVYDYGTFSGVNDRQWKFELWTSRASDGTTWTKLDEDWLWAGSGTNDNTPGEWDAGAIKPGAWVSIGSEDRYYYCGSSEVHHPLDGRDNFVDQHRVGYATLGHRRLTGMSGTGNVVLDVVSAPTGGRMRVTGTNISNVQLLDGNTGLVMGQYQTSDPVPADATDHVVTWGGSSGLPSSFYPRVDLVAGEINFVEVLS